MTRDVIDAIERAKLVFVATVRTDGTTNLSPKGSLRVLDSEHLIFADIASPQTVENLRTNPGVEVNAVDFIARKGYRFRGTAEVVDPGHADFDFIEGWLRSMHGDSQPCHHPVRIKVAEVAELLSPAYTIDHVPEPELRQTWIKKYGLAEA